MLFLHVDFSLNCNCDLKAVVLCIHRLSPKYHPVYTASHINIVAWTQTYFIWHHNIEFELKQTSCALTTNVQLQFEGIYTQIR